MIPPAINLFAPKTTAPYAGDAAYAAGRVGIDVRPRLAATTRV